MDGQQHDGREQHDGRDQHDGAPYDALDAAPARAASAPGVGRAFASYTGLRLVLFACVCATLYLLGLTGLPLLAVAVLLSSVLSLLMLKPQREALAAALVSRDTARSDEKADLRARLDETDTSS